MSLSREVKVGVFVFLGLFGAAVLIFLIGDNKSLFDSKVPYHVRFEDVQGVKPGSTVRMGGVLRKDGRAGVSALSRILTAVDSGDGYAARLLNDRKEADRLSRVVANLEQTTAHLDDVLAGVDQVVARINSGPGLAHEVLYG